MIEKMKKSVDKKGIAGALITDLSKEFDCLNHELFIGELNSYRFSSNALKLKSNYLHNRKLQTRIDETVSERCTMWYNVGVPQGSILASLLL